MTLIYKGVVGLHIREVTSYNLEGYVSARTKIRMMKPDGTVTELTPSSVDTTLGYINFITSASTLATAGEYRFQPHAEFNDGDVLNGEIDTVQVFEPLVITP